MKDGRGHQGTIGRMNSARVFAASGAVVILSVAAVAQSNPTAELNGGMEAQIISSGLNTRDALHPSITMALKISNKGTSTAFVLLVGPPDLVDDSGSRYELRTVTGLAYCHGPYSNPPTTERCVGIPAMDGATFSPRAYTRIDPGRSIIVNLSFAGRGQPGKQVTLSGQLGYRLVGDTAKDADLSDADKLKQVQLGTLSFEPVTVAAK